jgi:hypothetical protein
LLTISLLPRFRTESKMDETVVKRSKIVWAVTVLSVTGVVLVQWGFLAAAAAAVAFVGASLLAFIAYILYLLMGDAPVAWRIVLIALFFIGLLVEIGAIVAVLGWLLQAVEG